MAVNFLPQTPHAAQSNAKVGAKDEDSNEKLPTFSDSLAAAFGAPGTNGATSVKPRGDAGDETSAEDGEHAAASSADLIAAQMVSFAIPVDASAGARAAVSALDGKGDRTDRALGSVDSARLSGTDALSTSARDARRAGL